MKPTQEQVIAWAREAGYHAGVAAHDGDLLQRFAALAYETGRKDENEACAKGSEDDAVGDDPACCTNTAHRIASAIRARREQ